MMPSLPSPRTPPPPPPPHLEHRRFGVGVAQRGWLTKDDVINAWPLAKLRRFLAEGRP
jgi:DNA polymerase (family X)